MRKFLNPRLERGEVRIEDIELDHKCRDDLSAILIGIQYLYSQEDLRERLFTLLDKYILPGTNRKVGRPGMDMWRIPVMGLLKQGLNRDYDRLHDLVNQHSDVRRFPGHAVIGDNYRYNYQTTKDNVSLLKPKLLEEVNQSVVESGHKSSGKESDEILRGRCGSFVVETNVHYPTDVNLLWDALYAPRGRARRLGSLCARLVPVEKKRKSVRRRFKMVRRTRRATPYHVNACLAFCDTLVRRVETCLPELAKRGIPDWKIDKIKYFLAHSVRQIDHIDRGLLKGGTIPQNEKVFSILEPHTRWNSKGKAGRPVELGVPVCIVEDQFGFILHSEIMWQGSDADFAAPMVEITRKLFPDFRAASFDRGFHSPENRATLDELLIHNVLPRKRYLGKAGRGREQGETFAAMRRQHPAVEPAINNLEQRGLDRVRAKGSDRFAHTVALAVVALNVHRLGRLVRDNAPREKPRRRHRYAA